MPDLEKPWVDHLEELRRRLIRVILFFTGFFVTGLFFNRPLIDVLTWPIAGLSIPLVFTSPAEGFLVTLKVAMCFALFASVPILLWHTWQFVKPGLQEKERGAVLPLFLASSALFLAGAGFCYFLVLPVTLKFLLGFGSAHFQPFLSVGQYSSFVGFMLLAFGVSFNFPLVLIGLASLGILTAAWLRHQRKIVILAIVILAAILTPSPDALSQLLLAFPLYLLFEITVVVTSWMEKKKPGYSPQNLHCS